MKVISPSHNYNLCKIIKVTPMETLFVKKTKSLTGESLLFDISMSNHTPKMEIAHTPISKCPVEKLKDTYRKVKETTTLQHKIQKNPSVPHQVIKGFWKE